MRAVPEEIVRKERAEVRRLFVYWRDYMNRRVTFWQLSDGIDIHTKNHCERVLMLALKLAVMRHVDGLGTEALCHAAIFHDTRRKDNFLDRGHGDRAADYYKEYCGENGDITWHPETFSAMKFHDRDDKDGEAFIRKAFPAAGQVALALEVYRDLKDADALDRYRLGPWGLNPKFLRSGEAKELMPYARMLVEETVDEGTMKKVMDATRQYAAHIKAGQ